MKRVALVLLVLAVAFAGLTWLALEGQEVVVLRSFSSDGAPRETRVWVAEDDGALWIEAATSERAWYRELLAQPEVDLVRGGRTLTLRAAPQPGPEGHARIRALLRARYGWADAYVGLLQDTSGSIAVRLEPR